MFTSTLHYNSMSNWHSSNSNSERAILHKYTSFQTPIQREFPDGENPCNFSKSNLCS